MVLNVNFADTKRAVETEILDLDIANKEYAQVCSSEKKKAKKRWKRVQTQIAILNAPSALAIVKAAYEKALKAIDATKLAIATEETKALELYGNLLSNEARQPQENIILLAHPGKMFTGSYILRLPPKHVAPSASASRLTFNKFFHEMLVRLSSTPSRSLTRFGYISTLCE